MYTNAPRHNTLRATAGFSLIEILVAVSLFSLVVSAITGMFLASFRAQRHAFAFTNAHNNVRFVFETLSREIRTGFFFENRAGRLVFENQFGIPVAYELRGTELVRCEGYNRATDSCDNIFGFRAVTSPEVVVEEFRFSLAGAGLGDAAQPRVTLLLRLRSQVGNQTVFSSVQTTVTQREVDS